MTVAHICVVESRMFLVLTVSLVSPKRVEYVQRRQLQCAFLN